MTITITFTLGESSRNQDFAKPIMVFRRKFGNLPDDRKGPPRLLFKIILYMNEDQLNHRVYRIICYQNENQGDSYKNFCQYIIACDAGIPQNRTNQVAVL